MNDRRLVAQTRSLGLGSLAASFPSRPAPAKLQNSDSGAFWYPLVPSGILGGRERWSSAPFLGPRGGSPGSSVVKNEKLVKFGKVLVKFLALFDHGLPKYRQADRFWTDFIRAFELDQVQFQDRLAAT